jgi:hypothetical protein
MADVAVRVPQVPDGVDWGAWAAAGVVAVHAPASAALDDAAAAGLEPIVELSAAASTEAVGAAGAAAVVLRDVAPGETLRPQQGRFIGAARLCGLDVVAISMPVENPGFRDAIERHGGDQERVRYILRSYLDARTSGYAPAELPATDDAVRLLLGDDSDAALAARTSVAVAMVQAHRDALAPTRARLLIHTDPLPVDRPSLLPALAAVADAVLVPVPEGLQPLLREAREAARRAAAGVSLEVPSHSVPNAERLADALDLVEGLMLRHVVLVTNPPWLAHGARVVDRAVHRLRGREGSRADERERRNEMLRA